MASSGFVQAAALLLAAQLLWVGAADQEPGTVIPAESKYEIVIKGLSDENPGFSHRLNIAPEVSWWGIEGDVDCTA